jgi:subtilisin-like proprotein convertase family protein
MWRSALRTDLVLCAALSLLLVAPVAFAQEKPEDTVGDEPATGPSCDVTGYKTERLVYPAPQAIPDNDAAGITLGPILMPPDGDLVNDVVLEIRAAHSWIGDLIVDLVYDPDCSGPAVGIPARVICRPRGAATDASLPCGSNTSTVAFGCPADLVATGTYLFSDEGLSPMGVGANCSQTLAAGCYRQSDQGGQAFSIWRGLPKGGCWSLQISDNEGEDTGGIHEWAVWVRNQRPVPATGMTWGSLKDAYR